MHQALAQAQCSSAEHIQLSGLPIRGDQTAVTLCSKSNQSSDTKFGTACIVARKASRWTSGPSAGCTICQDLLTLRLAS